MLGGVELCWVKQLLLGGVMKQIYELVGAMLGGVGLMLGGVMKQL